jgi:hypothetical protein
VNPRLFDVVPPQKGETMSAMPRPYGPVPLTPEQRSLAAKALLPCTAALTRAVMPAPTPPKPKGEIDGKLHRPT